MFRRIGRTAAIVMAMFIWVGVTEASGASAAPAQSAPKSSQLPQSDAAAQSFLLEAEALYEAVNGGEPSQISRRAARTEARLRLLPMEDVATAEGIEALARSVVRMKRLAASVSPDPDKLRVQAAQIRLAADAIAHPQAPMWHRYRAIMQEDLRLLNESVGKGENQAKQLGRFRDLQGHYELIRTAILIQGDTSRIEMTDSILRYAQRVLAAEQPNPAYAAGLIPSLQEAVGGLFPAQEDASSAVVMTPAAGPPWGWSAFMGVFVVAILSWVGWRRYQGLEPVNPRGSLPPAHRGHRR